MGARQQREQKYPRVRSYSRKKNSALFAKIQCDFKSLGPAKDVKRPLHRNCIRVCTYFYKIKVDFIVGRKRRMSQSSLLVR